MNLFLGYFIPWEHDVLLWYVVLLIHSVYSETYTRLHCSKYYAILRTAMQSSSIGHAQYVV
jgi:hypothetical protein